MSNFILPRIVMNNQPSTLSSTLLTILKNLFFEKKGVKEYRERLERYLANGSISPDEMTLLKSCEKKFSLTRREVYILHKEALKKQFTLICSDRRISDAEVKSLETLLDQFGLTPGQIDFDQLAFNRFSGLAMLDNGKLPIINNPEAIPIQYKCKEVVHFAESALLIKSKLITKRVNYEGLSVSVKIMKGVRYRVGSIQFTYEKQEVHDAEDVGFFYITNQRIGFQGKRKQFNFSFKKIHCFEVRSEGIYIFKDGKENPYIIQLGDYELPLSIISHIINQ